jgi:hypothetical protein
LGYGLCTKEERRFGISNLKLQNQGLLLKYLHKFYNKEDTAWVHLLWNSYYIGKVPHAITPSGSFWWKDVCKLMPIYRSIASPKIGNGRTALFWKDKWLNTILSDEYPRAFSYALTEDITVTDFLSATSLAENFNLPLSPEALQEVRQLQIDAQHVDLQQNTQDKWVYEWKSDKYSSRLYYKYCFRELKPHISIQWLWKSKSIPRMKFFGWLLLSDRINTRNMLRRRNFTLNTGYNCLLCDNPPEEMVEHLFFHCPFSQECWSRLHINWPLEHNRLQIIEHGKTQWKDPLFMEVFLIGAWNIWKERNNLHFKNITPTAAAWKRRFIEDFGLLKYRTKEGIHPYIDHLISSL